MGNRFNNGGVIGTANVISRGSAVTTFNSSGNYSVPITVSQVRVLVIAGGGSGGSVIGGGGGGGGFRDIAGVKVQAGSTTPVTVGAGGASAAYNSQSNAKGSDSVFGSAYEPITSTGGGRGGTLGPAGGDGGSGGGNAYNNESTAGQGNTPPVSPSQGNDGGSGSNGYVRIVVAS